MDKEEEERESGVRGNATKGIAREGTSAPHKGKGAGKGEKSKESGRKRSSACG